MTLVLHEHPFASYCWKALIALFERGVPFERNLVADAEGRERLAAIWPMASIPVLVDEQAGLTIPESTAVVEHLDRIGDAPPLIPGDPAEALQARLWDRIVDGHVATPMQKIVGDSLRDEADRDPHGVAEAREHLERAYALLDDRLAGREWLGAADFSLADCAAAPALHYVHVLHRWDAQALPDLTRYFEALMARPSVARVVDEARPYRSLFPLPWPDHAA